MGFLQVLIGRGGESLATRYLRSEGFSILHKNFRTAFVEIDVIAQKGDTVYLFEVKTTTQEPQDFDPEQGTLDTAENSFQRVTPKKIRSLEAFADSLIRDEICTDVCIGIIVVQLFEDKKKPTFTILYV